MLSVESNEKLQCQPKVAPMVRIELYPRPIQHGRYGSSRNQSRANWHKHRTIHDKSPLSIMETAEDSPIDAAFRHPETGLSAEDSACETIDSLFDDMNNQHISQVQGSGFAYMLTLSKQAGQTPSELLALQAVQNSRNPRLRTMASVLVFGQPILVGMAESSKYIRAAGCLYNQTRTPFPSDNQRQRDQTYGSGVRATCMCLVRYELPLPRSR